MSRGMSNKPLVSYIIVTHNRKNLLEKLLNSIIAQKFNDEYEIIVVDDASTDGTYEFLQNFIKRINCCKIKVIRNRTTQFVATSRNIGAMFAQGKYLFFIDDDVILDDNCTRELVNFLKNNPDFVAATPLILDNWGKPWACGIKRSYLGLNYSYFPRNIPHKGYVIVDEAITAYIIRSDDFKRIKGYNHKYLFYYEESEMFHRLKLVTGKKIACVLKAKVYHHIEKNKLWKINPLKAYLLGRNRVWFYKEWRRSSIHYILSILSWIILCYTYYLLNFIRFKNLASFALLLKGINSGLRFSP